VWVGGGGGLQRGVQQKDESPLTSVRGRGHSSHLVCSRTSGFLLLSPPPPSPSRLHGGFLFLASSFRKRRVLSGVRTAGSSNASRLSLSPSPSFYCSVAHSTLCCPCLPPASLSLSSYPLCHAPSLPPSSFPFYLSSLFKEIICYPSTAPHPTLALYRPSLCSFSPGSVSRLIYPSEQRGRIVQCRRLEAEATPAAAAERCLVIYLFFFLQAKTEEAVPPTCSYHTAAAAAALCADCSPEDR